MAPPSGAGVGIGVVEVGDGLGLGGAGAEPGVGGEDAVIAVAVDAGRRDEAGKSGEEVERREGDDGAAVGCGTGQVIEDLADAGVVGFLRSPQA